MSEDSNNPIESQNEKSFMGWQLYNERNAEIIVAEHVKELFLSNTITSEQSKTKPCSAICIDERARAVDREDDVLVNFPGGGFEYMSLEDIDKIIDSSNGQITLFAHDLCGWGSITFQDLLVNTTNFEGRQRVAHSIVRALQDNYYITTEGYDYNDSTNEEAVLFVEAEHKRLLSEHKLKIDDFGYNPQDEAFYLKAFAFGELLTLRERIIERAAERFSDKEFKVNVRLDNLEEQPHNHIANDAIVNSTSRVFIDRPQLNGKDVFVADINISKEQTTEDAKYDRMNRVVSLIFQIMEGDHSDTSDSIHGTFILCSETDKTEIDELIESIIGGNLRRKIITIGLSEEEINGQKDPLPSIES